MIIPQLMTFLEQSCSESRLKSYKSLLPFLHQVDPTVFEFSFSQFVSFNDDFDTVNNIDQFTQFVTNNLVEIIESFGVYLSETERLCERLDLLNAIAQGLFRIDQYENLLSIKYILDVGTDPREILGDILHLMDDKIDVDHFLIITNTVSPALVARIRSLLDDLDYQIQEGPSIDHALVELTQNAISLYEVSKAVSYFKDGGHVGDSLNTFLDYFFSTGKQYTSEELARLALLSGVASNTPIDQIKKVVGEQLSYYLTDVTQLMSVTRIINKLPLPEVAHAAA